MKRFTGLAIVICAFVAFVGCGYSPGNSPGVTFTVSPPDGSIDQALDVAVTVDFADEISEPADWMSAFMLKEGIEGDTLCSDVYYSAQGKRATCEHANLQPFTDYSVIVTGIVAVSGDITTFRTVE